MFSFQKAVVGYEVIARSLIHLPESGAIVIHYCLVKINLAFLFPLLRREGAMGHNNSKMYNNISMFLLFMPFLSMMTIRLLREIISNKNALRLIVHYLIVCVLSLLKSKK